MTEQTKGAHDDAPDEDPEQHIGAPMADPWDDDGQTDWRTGPLPAVD